jgi:hypothetical protein
MARQRLPNRRIAETFELEVSGLRYTVTLGRHRDGRILEVFLQNHKPGSQSDANARDAAVAASTIGWALKHGELPHDEIECCPNCGHKLRVRRGIPPAALKIVIDWCAEQEARES